jgi:cellulose synthase/poly-beta-1,6-N-acetylglucosamine synthase-like glycosyltransferase
VRNKAFIGFAVLAFIAVCFSSALFSTSPSGPASVGAIAGSTAPPTSAATQGLSGGLLPRAEGVQAAGDIVTPPRLDVGAAASSSSGTGGPVLSAVVLLIAAVLTAIAATTLWWMLHAWRTPSSLTATTFTRRGASRHRSFSLILPARHEQEVLGDTLDSLAALDHPDFEVLAVVGHDDPETEAVARAAAERYPDRITVVVDHQVPKNKPKALNTALGSVRGDITGVFDAEDEVHTGLLRLVEARFEETGADVVQAGVQLMNIQSSWWSLRNCLEYYFWFRSRLHFHAGQRFIPLGGNTVFVRSELLRQHNGWDAECLAEDCEIGVRLSVAGAKVAVAYDPETVTREETPDSIRALVKQRTRWDQGFLQVLRKGEWKRLPTSRQRGLARFTLAMPFLQALTGLLIPLSVAAMFLLKLPVAITLATFVPLLPTLVTLAVESVGLTEFGAAFGVRIRVRDYLRLVIGTFPYQILLAFAALRAVWRQARGQGGWEKTSHSNVHRTSAIQPVGAARAGAA